MRLLDQIAQRASSHDRSLADEPWADARHLSRAVHACPLRLVLADDLTRCSTALAYSDGERLSGCLDLIRVPSERLWIEWAESPRLEELCDILQTPVASELTSGRCGVLISADASGRSGTIRAIWSNGGETIHCAQLSCDFDLDRCIRRHNSVSEILEGDPAGLGFTNEPAFDAILNHVCFRFDPAFLQFHRASNLPMDQLSTSLVTALARTAFIIPMVLALFLLLAAKGGTEQRAVNLEKINKKRDAYGKPALLDHVEVVTSLLARGEKNPGRSTAPARAGRRLHHVRGHLTRRGQNIFWRAPHLRGDARFGIVRSRTVTLTFH